MKLTTRRIAIMAMLTALSVILTYFKLPIFPAAAYLEYEAADVPILIGAFLLGPVAGIILTILVSAIQALTVSAQAGFIGFCMHVFATGAFSAVSALIYARKKTLSRAAVALASGGLVMVAIMIPLNLIFAPLYGVPIEAVKQGLIPIVLPFNAIKAGLNSVLSLLVFSQISRIIKSEQI